MKHSPDRGCPLKILVILRNAVLLIEALDTSLRGNASLLSGVERMALGAGLNVNFLLRGAGRENITAVAGNLALVIGRMDSFSHFYHLFNFADGFQTSAYNATSKI